MLNFKKPEFIQRLTIKRIALTLSGASIIVIALGAGLYSLFNNSNNNDGENQEKFQLNKGNTQNIQLNSEVSSLVLNKNNASDTVGDLSAMQTIISGQNNLQNTNDVTQAIINGNQSAIGNNSKGNIGSFSVPLGSTVDTSYQNNTPVDISKLTDKELEDYYTKQNGLKIVKVASYNQNVPLNQMDTAFNSQNPNPTNQQRTDISGSNPSLATIVAKDNNGNPIYGYTKDGKPIYGYDKNGKPILTQLGKVIDKDNNGSAIVGYDSNGMAIYGKDNNGNAIYGYTKDGKPIYGYDKNGNPILNPLSKVIGKDNNGNAIIGYTKDGKAITDATKNIQNKIVGYDNNGNAIYGYTKDGKPIYGYDKNGNPISTPLNKIIGKDNFGNPIVGYDSNGAPIYGKDKSGNVIYGYTKDGKPIYGYDNNGNPILTPLNKAIAVDDNGSPIYGYDKNGNPIANKNGALSKLDNIASVGNFGAGQVPALSSYQIKNGNNNSFNPNEVNSTNSDPKRDVITRINSNNQGSGNNANGQPPLSSGINSNPSSQEVDRTPPLVSLNFKDIKPNNGFINYDNSGQAIESNQVVKLNESSNSSINKQSDTQQKRIMLTNKFTIRAGDYIPAIMQTGVNSDLPGSITARVSENVYDTATGKYLLIPVGAKLLGSYSANIQYGQERILAAWNEIIYPDGSIVMLNNQPGTDLAGYSGINDLVNNHYWKLFGNTFILSVLTTGLGYSQNNSSNSQNGSGFNQQLSANTGQMMGQAASTIIQKSINIAPTLTVRNGYRMNVLLTQDIVLDSPYRLTYYK